MPKTALLFPGQGSQRVGMGLDLAETFPSARAIFDQADETLGFSLSKLCFEGPEEDLKLTENTQPAILTCSMAVLAVMREEGLANADFVAGHSLGEYSALVAAGALGLPMRSSWCASAAATCRRLCLRAKGPWRPSSAWRPRR
ncbi:MAG: ACP S-malonyltransferase [Bryobacterales bacterium]